MTWVIEFSEAAEAELRALDTPIKRRIVRFLRERLEPVDDPRSIGAPLRGPELGRYWSTASMTQKGLAAGFSERLAWVRWSSHQRNIC